LDAVVGGATIGAGHPHHVACIQFIKVLGTPSTYPTMVLGYLTFSLQMMSLYSQRQTIPTKIHR